MYGTSICFEIIRQSQFVERIDQRNEYGDK